jgi:hypothetical protein
MTAAQFCRFAARMADMDAAARDAVAALAAADVAAADAAAPRGTTARRDAERLILELHDAGAPVAAGRPTAARTMSLFAD